MDVLRIGGGKPLHGEISVSGAKNVALKILIASLLTDDEIVIHNVPLLRDVYALIELLEYMGVSVMVNDHTLRVCCRNSVKTEIPLELGGKLRTSSLVLGPLLARYGKAHVPNPGGCRLGARPIDRHIDGLRKMGAAIEYNSEDGFFHATTDTLHGATIEFFKNTHTGTETIILAAVLASGVTEIRNAANEVEVDDLIAFLNSMGAKIQRVSGRTIRIEGVSKLHGCQYSIMPDRNEEVTLAIAASVTGGTIIVNNSQRQVMTAFLDKYREVGGVYEEISNTRTRYIGKNEYKSSDIVTMPHPGFMTDWQAPWAMFMTQAQGVSTIHETVFESRFAYVTELAKMGAKIEFFEPHAPNPDAFYNFNWSDRKPGTFQGIKITGPTKLHNAILEANDIRAGATLILAALAADGESYVHNVHLIDRGYEHIETKLAYIGADIVRIKEEEEYGVS